MGKDYSIARSIILSPEESKRRKYTVAETRPVSISFTKILLRWVPWEKAVLITQTKGLLSEALSVEKTTKEDKTFPK